MSPGNIKRGIKGFDEIFAAVRRSIAPDGDATLLVCEEQAPQWHDARMVRFFQRLGAVPQTWTPQRAALRICIGAGDVAAADGLALEAVYAILKAFVEEEDPGYCRDAPRCAQCPLRDRCRYVSRNPSVKDLPPGERPRDRLLSAGREGLSDAELLSLILRDGTSRESALDLAKKLLARFGGFRQLAACTVSDLRSVRGIGPVKAAQLVAAFEMARRFASQKLEPGATLTSSTQVFLHFHEELRHLKKETFVLVLLDQKHRVIRTVPISEGSLTQSIVHPREVFRPAIAESAAAVIFVHNHPSGDPVPSQQDRALTRKLVQVAELVGIRVLDHVIIGDDRFLSFAEQGYL